MTPRDIIDAILDNMEDSAEEIYFNYQVPGVYQVYLHSADYRRLEGLFSEIAKQAEFALEEKLGKLNKKSRLSLKKRIPFENAHDGWCIEFHPDPNEELQPGEAMVESLLPIKKDEAAGVETQRVSTVKSGGETKTARSQAPTYARISYTDDSGKHTYAMSMPKIFIGRGGQKGTWVDLRLFTKPDVSRRHLRLRLDQKTGRFYVLDLSKLGTSIDGSAIPGGVGAFGNEQREREVERPLPQRARIGLADVIILHFESMTGK
ncbi:MAG: FHA domain-containing protein [Acidobacteriota bacterium]